MSKEISKELVCLITMNKSEIWIEKDKLPSIMSLILENSNNFIEINGGFVRASQIVEVKTVEQMEEVTRRKNGEWKCKYGTWHKKFEECNCKPVINEFEKTKELYKPIERKNSHEHNMETLKNCINKKI